MYCDKCGKEVDEGSVFCPNCGKLLERYVSYNESYNKTKIEINDGSNHTQLNLHFGRHKHFVDFYAGWKVIIAILIFIVFFGTFAFLAYRVKIDDEVETVGKIFLYIVLGIFTLGTFVMFCIFIKSMISTFLGRIVKHIGKDDTATITNIFSHEATKVIMKKNDIVYSYYIVYEYNIGHSTHQTTQHVSERTYFETYIGQTINIKRDHIIGVYIEKNFN